MDYFSKKRGHGLGI
uniref:Uncharacterized protein n=1 Tax=Rhizophora mucronata TaxID=61149 RepID=A0A2P2QA04_RHIMU